MKKVYFPTKGHWYDQIKAGTKKCELRAASRHWLTRIGGASSAIFTRGCSTGKSGIYDFSVLR